MPNDSRANEKPVTRWYSITPTRYLFCFLVLQAVLYCGQWFPSLRLSQHKGWSVILAVTLTAVLLLALFIWVLIAWLARLRIQFGLATLMLIVPVAAIPFGWFALELSRARQQREVFFAVKNRGDDVSYHPFHDPTSGKGMLGGIQAEIGAVLGKDFFADLKTVDVASMDVVKNIRHLSRLEVLAIRNCHLSDNDLRDLEALPQLKQLTLAYTKISDSGLWCLERTPQLRSLNLSHTNVTDAGLVQVGRVSSLEELSLVATPVTDKGVGHLKELKKLKALLLSDTRITDGCLAQLTGLTNLQRLSCEHTQITDDGLERLSDAESLSDLNLKGTHVTDAGLKYLESVANLRFLELEETSVTIDAVERLRRVHPRLQVLYFPATP